MTLILKRRNGKVETVIKDGVYKVKAIITIGKEGIVAIDNSEWEQVQP